MSTEFVCKTCEHVLLRSDRSFEAGEKPKLEDLERVDPEMPELRPGSFVLCPRCDRRTVIVVRGDAIDGDVPMITTKGEATYE